MKKIISILGAAVLTIGLLAGCSSKGNGEYESGKLKDVHEAVKTAMGEEYYPNMPLGEEEIEEIMGISKDMYSEIIVEVPMISMNPDTFIGAEAAKGKGDALEEALNKYKDYLANESFQYPMNMPKVQAVEVVRKGDYAFLIMLGQVPQDLMESEDEDAKVAAVKEGNKKAVDAINSILK